MSLDQSAARRPTGGHSSDDELATTRAPLVRSERLSAPARLRRREAVRCAPEAGHLSAHADDADAEADPEAVCSAHACRDLHCLLPPPHDEALADAHLPAERRRSLTDADADADADAESSEQPEAEEGAAAEGGGASPAADGASVASSGSRRWAPGEVNLGFEDTEPDLRYVDISRPECDHLPWYFSPQGSSGRDRSHRPHSIAVADVAVERLQRRDPLRATAPHRHTVGERPQSATCVQLASESVFPSAPRLPSDGDLAVSHSSASSLGSGDIDWSWVSCEEERQRRASMRRLEPQALPPPPPPPAAGRQLPPLGAPPPLQMHHRPCRASAPPAPTLAHIHAAPIADFPRRYSMSAVGRRLQSLAHRPSASSTSSSSTDSTPDDGPRRASETEERNGAGRRSRGGDCGNSGAQGCWPHGLSCMFATLGCTLGLFNISRFAVFSVQFGANFILQFLFLTLVLGIPLLTVQASLGQYLNAGIMDMWRISPIFQGIGIALLASQALIGIYSIVGVSWMFIYFRDSFITKQDQYPWAVFEQYREEPQINGTHKLEETVPDYLNGMVLQRQSLVTPDPSFGHLKFQVTFNLAVVWMIVFVSLSKGLKSYGKVVYVFSVFSVLGMLILCTKILGLTNTSSGHQVFPETVWSEFFINTKCWVAATTEVFYTWGLLGAAVMQITSHNQHKHLLHRDISIVIIVTLAVLLLSAFLANTCVELLAASGYTFIPSSFEQLRTVTFLQAEGAPLHPILSRTPVRYMSHSIFILGSRVLLPGMDSARESGYQVLRLATELAPATFALMGSERVSPFWAVLFYFVLITFGIAQQLAIWHCVITGITAIKSSSLKSWETTITFFSCACGFVLGLPMTTELGIFVVYFMDFVVGSGWWIMVLYILQIAAVFVVRGRPYSGESVVSTLFTKGSGCLQVWAGPMLVFTWNVILPVALMVLCITIFKNGRYREIYIWHNTGHDYWPLWVREIGSLMQILPLLAGPLVAVIQSCRYLSGGPPDLFDRIRLLYRPPVDTEEGQDNTRSTNNVVNTTSTTNIISSPVQEPAFEDPPPKYTPPPSYTTATGARIAKLLRQSFRRSVRRITQALTDSGNTPESSAGPRSLAAAVTASSSNSQAPPPDYAAVLVEMNCPVNSEASINPSQSTMTAAEVVSVLRSSVRRPVHRSQQDNLEPAKVERHSTSLI